MQAFDLKVFVVCACLAATQEADWWGSWWDDPRSRCGRWWSDQLRGIREDDDGQVSHHITSAEAKASSPQLHSFNAPVLDFVVWALLSFRGRLYHGSPFEHPTEFKDAKDIRVRRSICSMHSLFHATSVSLDFSYWSPTIFHPQQWLRPAACVAAFLSIKSPFQQSVNEQSDKDKEPLHIASLCNVI